MTLIRTCGCEDFPCCGHGEDSRVEHDAMFELDIEAEQERELMRADELADEIEDSILEQDKDRYNGPMGVFQDYDGCDSHLEARYEDLYDDVF